MATLTRLATAEELAALGDDSHYELIRGELREKMATKLRHGKVGGRFTKYLHRYADDVMPGEVIHSETGYHLEDDPDSVVMPDVTFIRLERMPSEDQLDEFARVVPDLIVEVLSPSNTRPEVDEKLDVYRAAGVPLVWVANPKRRLIEAHGPNGLIRIYRDGEDLDGGDALPGFRVPVAAFFD